MEKDNLKEQLHLENIGNRISNLVGKEKENNFKIIISESPQIGVLQIKINESRISDINELTRAIKRYYVELGFKIGDEGLQGSFKVLKKDFEYLISTEYSSLEQVLTVSIDKTNEEDFSLFG